MKLVSSRSTNFNSSIFGGEDVIFGSELDVFQEVIVEEEIQHDINVDGNSSASPVSMTNDGCSNENSMSSFAASETQNRFGTRIEDFRSEVLPENFFNETEDDPSLILDPSMLDHSVNLNEDSGFAVNSLFPIKEEVGENDVKFPGSSEETLKKGVRRRTKQGPIVTTQKPKYVSIIKQEFILNAYSKCLHLQISRLHLLSLYEEKILFKKLKQLAERNGLNGQQKRLYRKLSLRNTKRSLGMEPFNYDKSVANLAKQDWTCQENVQAPVSSVTNVLDQFQKRCLTTVTNSRSNTSFRMKLLGSGSHIPQHFISPFTDK